MAKELRKLQRAQGRQADGGGKAKKKAQKEPVVVRPDVPDPMSAATLKPLFTRLGLPVLAAWIVGGLIAGVSTSKTIIVVALTVPGLLTLLCGGIVFWALRQMNKAKGVASILSKMESKDDRKAALEQIDNRYKAKDPAAIFAKAQILLQEDPREALAVLETINLGKVMAPVADEARGQRAMIHLMIGEVAPARDLADAIDLSRHQDAKARAMLGSVVAEAWARSGQAKRAVETIELFDPEDVTFDKLGPQLWRARAFAYAYVGRNKEMKRALKKLVDQDPRLLAGFLIKKTHPLLQKEARQMLEQSGAMQRKMQVQRG